LGGALAMDTQGSVLLVWQLMLRGGMDALGDWQDSDRGSRGAV
jgi:hypothetical protein